MIRDSRMLRRIAVGSGTLTAMLMLSSCGPSTLYNPNELLGFPTATPGSMGVPDGVPNDGGWSNSFRMFLEDGSVQSAAFMRGVVDQQYLYLYVEATDPVYENTDTLILAFNPTNATDKYARLHITPCLLTGGGVCPGTGNVSTSNLQATVSYQTGTESGGNVTWTPAPTPAEADVYVRSATAPNGNANRWAVEIRINRAAAAYPFLTTGTFGMFVDAIVTKPGGFGMPATATQYSWPLGSYVGANDTDPPTSIDINTAALALPRWGNATLDMTKFVPGLQITGFGSNNADPSSIAINQPNEFVATVANSPAGGGAAAAGVQASFQINNIGLHPSWTWTAIPPTPVPSGPQTINPQEYFPFSSGEWTLQGAGSNWQGSGKTDQEFFTDNPHQCIRVNVANSGPLISRYYNMNFVTVNSPFDMNAEIATDWRKEFGEARGIWLNEEFLNVPFGFAWKSAFGGADAMGDRAWAIRKLDGKPFQVKQRVDADASLSVPSVDYVLDVAALSRGKSFDVPVKAGSALTLIAEGEGKIRDRVVGPGGLNNEAAAKLQIETANIPDVLRRGSKIRTGALMGSFDGFRTAFAIGTGSTFYVPGGAATLSLRLATNVPFDGGTIRLQAIETAPTPVALDGLSPAAVRAAKQPILLPLGGNLPMHVVRGTLDMGKVIVIGKQKFQVGVPMGSYGSLIRRVGVPGPAGPAAGPLVPGVPPVLRPVGTATPLTAATPAAVRPR